MKQHITIPGAPCASSSDARQHRVSLSAIPWVDGEALPRDPREETAPARGIMSPRARTPVESFIAALRQECAREARRRTC